MFAPFINLIGVFGEGWFWAVVGAALAFWLWFFSRALDREAERRRYARDLQQRRWGRRYRRTMVRIVRAIHRRLTPGEAESPPPPQHGADFVARILSPLSGRTVDRKALRRSGRAPWGWPLLDLCLRAGVVYPIFLLFIVWAVSGEAGLLGRAMMFPEASDAFWSRVAVLGGVVLAAIALLFRAGLTAPFMLLGAIALTAAGTGAIAFDYAERLGVSIRDSFAIGGSGAFSLVASLAALFLPGIFSIVIAVSLAVVVASLSVFIVRLTGDEQSAFSLYNGVLGALFNLSAVPFAFAIVALVRTGLARLGYALLFVGLAVIIYIAAFLAEGGDPRGPGMLVFLGVLPLTNALFDFLSLGLTRYLLTLGALRARWAIWLGLADLGGALVLFVGLGFATVLAVHAVNLAHFAGGSPTPLLDLQTVFDDLRDPAERGRYWWLFVAFFSTFLPTLLHAGVACFSLVAHTPGPLKRWVAAQFPKEGEFATENLVWATGGMILIASLATVAPLVLVYWLALAVQSVAPWVGEGYLWLFESFARWIGAAVTPGPVGVWT